MKELDISHTLEHRFKSFGYEMHNTTAMAKAIIFLILFSLNPFQRLIIVVKVVFHLVILLCGILCRFPEFLRGPLQVLQVSFCFAFTACKT